MCVCMYVCMCVCMIEPEEEDIGDGVYVCMYVCIIEPEEKEIRAGVCVSGQPHTPDVWYIHTTIHTYIHTYIHTEPDACCTREQADEKDITGVMYVNVRVCVDI